MARREAAIKPGRPAGSPAGDAVACASRRGASREAVLHPFWHPLSTLLSVDPPCYASPGLLRMLLAGGPLELRYAGDRMWPAATHGALIEVRRPGSDPLGPGAVVVAALDGIPDLLRVTATRGESITLAADADPACRCEVGRDAVLAIAALDGRVHTLRRAALLRRWLDLREAWSGTPDAENDPATTVRDKYEAQAPFYAGAPLALDDELSQRIRDRVRAGGHVLVVGSGAGHECFALVRAGYRVSGLDFAPAMIERASELAQRSGCEVDFRLGDLRDPALELDRYDGVLFTFDVYSFLPRRAARVRVLERLNAALAPGGVIFLSARLVRSSYERAILTLEHLRHPSTDWGDSHTRWIDTNGTLRRSFVHLFTRRALAEECAAAGLELASWAGGHGLVIPRRAPRAL